MKRVIHFTPLFLAVFMFGSTVSFAQRRDVVIVRDGDLRAAAAAFHSASSDLVDSVLEATSGNDWRRDDRVRDLKRLMARANEFSRAAVSKPYPALRDDWNALRYSYNEVSSNFDRLPRRGEVSRAVDRTRNAMERLVRAYERGPVRPGPGPGSGPGRGNRAEMADAIDKATDQVRDDAKEVAHDGDTRGSGGDIKRVLERLDYLADRASKLEDAAKDGDRNEIRDAYRRLRNAYVEATPEGRFGPTIDDRYRRISRLIDRFGDTIGTY